MFKHPYKFRIEALGEAAIVGGIASVIGWLVASKFKEGPIAEHFIAGAILHLILEASGIHHRTAHKIVDSEITQGKYLICQPINDQNQ